MLKAMSSSLGPLYLESHKNFLQCRPEMFIQCFVFQPFLVLIADRNFECILTESAKVLIFSFGRF